MHQIRIQRRFNATHALRFPDGSAEPVHGHDWGVSVEVAADALDETETVMDFHELERIVGGVLEELEHSHLNDLPAFAETNPTAERVAEHIFKRIQPQLPQRVRLGAVSTTEAPGCMAYYRPR